MNSEFAILKRAINNISGGEGGNPTGGSVDIATVNYNATLQGQFNAYTIGSSSASLLNLPNSIIEPMNLYLNSVLYSAYIAVTNAVNDNKFALKTANGSYLQGLINPVHLRLSAHFNGTETIPSSIVAADSPIYNAELGTIAKLNINTNVYKANTEFINGTPTANAGTASNAFDNTISTGVDVGYNSGNPVWVKYDFGVGVTKILFDFYVYFYAYVSQPTWIIAASNDDSNWDTLASGNMGGATTLNRRITTANTTAYRYYKFQATANSGLASIKSFDGYSYLHLANYDTINYKLGTSSVKCTPSSYLSGVAQNVNELQLGVLDWQMRGFFRFSSSPNPMTLFTILGKQLEIQATSTGLRVNYSTNGTSFTAADSSAISWSTDTWYFISVRRTGNTLYFYVDGTAYGTVDLTGVTFFATSTNTFYVGADSSAENLLVGNIDELEFFIGENTVDTEPIAERSTAFIPELNIVSAATYIKSGVTLVNCLLFLDEVQFASFGVPTINTDCILSVSLDNGSTWTAITLEKVANLTTAVVSYSGTLTVDGLTNTNQFKYKIVSASGKVCKFDGAIFYWN